MNFKRTTLGVAVATTLGFASSANAGVYINNDSSGDPVKIAKERSLETVGEITDTLANVIKFPAIPGYTVNSNNTLFVKVSLLGGAQFKNTPQLQCFGTDNGAANAGVDATFQIGGENSDTVSFSLPENFKVTASDASGSVCQLFIDTVGGGYKLGSQATVEVSALIRYKDGLTAATTAYKGNLITFNTAAIAAVNPGDASVTIDVSKGSKEFANSLPTTTTAYLGFVKYSLQAGVVNIDNSVIANNTVISTASITVDGPSIAGAAKVFLQKPAGNEISAGNAACTNGTTVATITAPTASSITFTGITPADIENGVAVCLNAGDNALEQGQVVASVEFVSQTGYTADATLLDNANKLVKVEKNGATIRVLNIPKPGGTEKAFLRFYNPTSQPVRVSGTLYDEAGTTLGTGVLFTAVPGFDVNVLSSDTLAEKLGGVTWTGRAWLKVEAESDLFKVLATLRDKTGTLINMSTSTGQ